MSLPMHSSKSAAAFPLLHETSLHIFYFSSRPTELKCLLWQKVKFLSPHFSCTKQCGWRVGRVIDHGEVMRCSAQLLLAAETKITALSLYWEKKHKKKGKKKTFLMKLMGYCLGKLRRFNPKLIGEKRIYIYSGKKSVMKPNTTSFWILYLNAKLFSGDPCPKEKPTSGLKGRPWMPHRAV